MAETTRRELIERVVSGLVLATIVVADAVIGGWSFSILVGAFAVLMAVEWGRLVASVHGRPELGRAIAIAPALVAVAGIVVGKLVAGWAALTVIAVATVGTWLLARKLRWPAGWLAGGVAYVAIGPVALVWMRNATDQGLVFVLFLFAAVWAADSFAFFLGRAIGGPRLAPRWSPSKTWAGFLGGIAAAAMSGAIMAYAFALPFIGGAAVLGGVLGAIAQAGDLFESWLKRRAGAKHSGRLIPGHGGVLDRLDGLIFATPAFALFALLHP